MVLGKKVAIFDWEWGQNSAPRDGQKMPSVYTHVSILKFNMVLHENLL